MKDSSGIDWLRSTALALGCVAAFGVSAQSLNSVVSEGKAKAEEGRKSQEKIDGIVEAKQEKLITYRALLKQVEGLEQYNKQLSTQIETQEALISRFDASIDQVAQIERQMLPLITRMTDALTDFVEIDLPFHETERLERIAFVQDSVQKPDLNVAEKFRQVLEAYQIENDYGRKIDTYQDIITIDGDEKEVDVLRVGRVALVAQTRDAATTVAWNHDEKAWKKLDAGTYRNSIREGIKMSKKQASIDLVTLPIPAPVAAETE
ncbi:DUF3450 domain-containing protein [uncultured Abyssibacter sp.]|uniref:DUF3450 domain-containing protein n=1 Tax=uncultured Abyssibacter sp. TaxID=2320202 RepID=UPI0032B2CC68